MKSEENTAQVSCGYPLTRKHFSSKDQDSAKIFVLQCLCIKSHLYAKYQFSGMIRSSQSSVIRSLPESLYKWSSLGKSSPSLHTAENSNKVVPQGSFSGGTAGLEDCQSQQRLLLSWGTSQKCGWIYWTSNLAPVSCCLFFPPLLAVGKSCPETCASSSAHWGHLGEIIFTTFFLFFWGNVRAGKTRQTDYLRTSRDGSVHRGVQ